jgi:hypothetical protein
LDAAAVLHTHPKRGHVVQLPALKPSSNELLREGIPLPLIERQLGHSHLFMTGTYLQGISSEELISTVRTARADDARQRRPRPVEHNHAGAHHALPDPADRPPRADDSFARKQQQSCHWPWRGKQKLRGLRKRRGV